MRSATLTHKRCSWASVDGPMLLQYHDLEWGIPVHDDRRHFEVLVLSGAQAGLSWSLVLKKREGYRRAFGKFDPEKVAHYSGRGSGTSTPTAGVLSAGGPSLTIGRLRGRFQRLRPNPTHSARTSSTGDSASSARRSFMPTCGHERSGISMLFTSSNRDMATLELRMRICRMRSPAIA